MISQQKKLIVRSSSMAREYTASEVVELLSDEEFGLSEDELSAEEGEDLYAYLGSPVISREEVEDLTLEVDTGGEGSSSFFPGCAEVLEDLDGVQLDSSGKNNIV